MLLGNSPLSCDCESTSTRRLVLLVKSGIVPLMLLPWVTMLSTEPLKAGSTPESELWLTVKHSRLVLAQRRG